MILLNSRQFYFIQNIEDEDGGVEWSGGGGGSQIEDMIGGEKKHILYFTFQACTESIRNSNLPVVCTGDSSVPLLSCCIPYLSCTI